MEEEAKIYVAGHSGMVGSAIVRRLYREGYPNILIQNHSELDLTQQEETEKFFKEEKPDYVFLAAARVGGIHANITHQAEFLYENLMIAANVIDAAYKANVKKLLNLGSSCIYPRECPQPMREDHLLTGSLEPTNEGYAIAKIATYKMAYYYAKQFGMNTISLMPCNLYGPNDNFDLETSHVFSALIRRFIDAYDEGRSSVTLWGTGGAKREFLHVDDLAKAAVLLMNKYNKPEIINVGSGLEISIRELANKIKNSVDFNGKILWDKTKPDGMLRKCLDISKVKALGFIPEISLDVGIEQMIVEYRKEKKKKVSI
jgi:GDP-L-fucose synthase